MATAALVRPPSKMPGAPGGIEGASSLGSSIFEQVKARRENEQAPEKNAKFMAKAEAPSKQKLLQRTQEELFTAAADMNEHLRLAERKALLNDLKIQLANTPDGATNKVSLEAKINMESAELARDQEFLDKVSLASEKNRPGGLSAKDAETQVIALIASQDYYQQQAESVRKNPNMDSRERRARLHELRDKKDSASGLYSQMAELADIDHPTRLGRLRKFLSNGIRRTFISAAGQIDYVITDATGLDMKLMQRLLKTKMFVPAERDVKSPLLARAEKVAALVEKGDPQSTAEARKLMNSQLKTERDEIMNPQKPATETKPATGNTTAESKSQATSAADAEAARAKAEADRQKKLNELVAKQGAQELAKMQQKGMNTDTLNQLANMTDDEAFASLVKNHGWVEAPGARDAAIAAIETHRRIQAGNVKAEAQPATGKENKPKPGSTDEEALSIWLSLTKPAQREEFLRHLLETGGKAGMILSLLAASSKGKGGAVAEAA